MSVDWLDLVLSCASNHSCSDEYNGPFMLRVIISYNLPRLLNSNNS